MTTDDESRIGWLLQDPAGDVPEPGTLHLDDNLLTGLVEGRLPDALRERLEGHLATCPDCRGILVARGAFETPAAYEPAVPEATAPTGWLRPALAVAAAVLLAVGVVVLDAAGTRAPAADTATLVARAAARIGSANAGLGGLGTIDWGALPVAEVERGGVVPHGPSGKVLTATPTLSWTTVPGVERYHVSVRNDLGDVVLAHDADSTSLAWPATSPALVPGTYVWKVEADAPLGRMAGRRSFQLPPAEERAVLRSELELIRTTADPRVADLLAAEHAARRGYLHAAAEAVARFVESHPQDPLGRTARAALARALGQAAE